MDKGVKGLLTGDVSIFLIQQIRVSIEKFQQRFQEISDEIANLMDKDKTLDQFYDENFQVQSALEQEKDYAPSYEAFANLNNFLSVMMKQDWKKHVQVRSTQNYSQFPGLDKEMLSPQKQFEHVVFQDQTNMRAFLQQKVDAIKTDNRSRIEALKQEINSIINRLYNEVLNKALELDRYRIPIHGIPFP